MVPIYNSQPSKGFVHVAFGEVTCKEEGSLLPFSHECRANCIRLCTAIRDVSVPQRFCKISFRVVGELLRLSHPGQTQYFPLSGHWEDGAGKQTLDPRFFSKAGNALGRAGISALAQLLGRRAQILVEDTFASACTMDAGLDLLTNMPIGQQTIFDEQNSSSCIAFTASCKWLFPALSLVNVYYLGSRALSRVLLAVDRVLLPLRSVDATFYSMSSNYLVILNLHLCTESLEGLQLLTRQVGAAEASDKSPGDRILVYTEASKKAASFLEPLENSLLSLGQAQLLRRSLQAELQDVYLSVSTH